MKFRKTITLLFSLVSTTMIGNAFAIEDNVDSRDIIATLAPEHNQSTTATTTTSNKDTRSTGFSDSSITAKVKAKFIEEKLFGKEKISAMGIHVKTSHGIVYLHGKVNSENEVQEAIKLAKEVEGVKDVKSSLKIKAESHKKDSTTTTHQD